MDSINQIINSNTIDQSTIVLRLIVSTAIVTIIGLERETHHQPAGLRTHILICLGSTLLMLISIFIPQQFENFRNGDPGRIAAQVVSGIGFLGAGAILKMGVNIRGLTTAASIWSVSAIGLAIGAGMFYAAIIAAFIVLLVLMIFETFEKKIFKPKNYKRFEITGPGNISIETLEKVFQAFRIQVMTIEMEKDIPNNQTVFQVLVHIYEDKKLPMVVDRLCEIAGVEKVKVLLPQ